MADLFPIIAKTFTGLEPVLAAELAELNALEVAPGRRMVSFQGDQALLYRVNLWCRTAVRILKPIHAFDLPEQEDASRALYHGVQAIDWSERMRADGTLAIDPVVHGARITNSLFAAQVAKDAIADWFRERTGRRPDVRRYEPDLRINLHIVGSRVTVYLDASDQSLHKRGYRALTGEAPLNEVLAAGIVRLSGWDRCSSLVDFMCGSGTLLIEAALWARNIAPGLLGRTFGYERWPDFDAGLHARLVAEARSARRDVRVPLYGSDLDPNVIAAACENATRARVADTIEFQVANFESVRPPAPNGTVLINPPYDERMRVERIEGFHRRLGDVLKRNWSGYTAWIFSGNPAAAKQIGLRTAARIPLVNGPIECRLLKFPLFTAAAPVSTIEDESDHAADEPVEPVQVANSPEASLAEFRNRLRRMGRHWDRWARRQGITCYRVYDRDVSDVPLSIDRYESDLLIAEHARPHARTPIEQRVWFETLVELAAAELNVSSDRVHAHSRAGSERGATNARSDARTTVHEAGLSFEVNLSGRGEIGLPLDQRELRSLLRAESAGRRVLNPFGRGGAASVSAAAGGARTTVTLESSKSLAEWTRRNLAQNRFAEADHVVIAAEPLEFLAQLERQGAEPFDLAVLAPSGSLHRRGDAETWDPRSHYLELLRAVLPLIAPGGRIYFLTSVRRFRLEADDLPQVTLREMSRQTIPPDFRGKPPHRCWSIVRQP